MVGGANGWLGTFSLSSVGFNAVKLHIRGIVEEERSQLFRILKNRIKMDQIVNKNITNNVAPT